METTRSVSAKEPETQCSCAGAQADGAPCEDVGCSCERCARRLREERAGAPAVPAART